MEIDAKTKRSKQIAVSRMEFLKKHNGTKIEPSERRDFEIFYLKLAYEDYLRSIQVKGEPEKKVESLDDPIMAVHMELNHPRFFELAHTYGSPLEMVNLKKEGKNISETSAKI